MKKLIIIVIVGFFLLSFQGSSLSQEAKSLAEVPGTALQAGAGVTIGSMKIISGKYVCKITTDKKGMVKQLYDGTEDGTTIKLLKTGELLRYNAKTKEFYPVKE